MDTKPIRSRTGLLTLLFTDIVGSVQFKETLGDREGVALIQQHHARIRQTLQKFPDGQEINTAGDSFLIAFTIPSDAVHFGLSVQSDLQKLKQSTGVDLQDRIGIHIGEVLIESDEGELEFRNLHGIQLDTCARVMSLAKGGQILMTRSVFDNARRVLKGQGLQALGPLAWISHGLYSLKGIEEPIEICEVSELGMSSLSPPTNSEKVQRCVSPDSEPVLGWRPAADVCFVSLER